MKKFMKEKKEYLFLAALLGSSLCMAGGYFVYVSCVVTVLLLIGIAFIYAKDGKKSKVLIPWDLPMLSISTMVFSYLITTIWSIDEGMVIWGFLKFFPALLFFLLLRRSEDKKEELIQLLPLFGTLMTIFSALMMQFEVFKEYVSVAGRLAGFFQYPNTYAIFMLICMIIAFYKIDWKKPDWLLLVYFIVALAGILLSGSRTTLVFLISCILYWLISKKEKRKLVLGGIATCSVVGIGLAFLGTGTQILERISSISLESSTLLGRFLYYLDAIPIILKNPFGLGYYGYYSIQQEIQTGVYSVFNVHNELLQFMLDIGIIPALLFYGCIVKNIVAKNRDIRDRLVLIMLCLHSLFDYDFQFVSMLFILFLFLESGKTKEMKWSFAGKIVVAIVSVPILIGSIQVGASEFFYTKGDNDKALAFYKENTAAKTMLLTQAETTEEMEQLADELLKNNAHSSIAYSAKARVAFSKGEIEQFMQYKIKAIDLAPYQYDEYLDYLDCLFFAFSQYQKTGDTESAKMCLKRVESVYTMLEELQEKTSSLAWKINDIPRVTLSHKYQQLLDEAKETLYE